MKRAFVDHRSHAVDEEARAKFKHQILLQEYLQLQKEFVAKKGKLQTTKRKRDTLFAEIRFLRQRRIYLLKIQSVKLDENLLQPQVSDMSRRFLVKKRNRSVNEAAVAIPYSVFVSNPDKIVEEGKGGEREQDGLAPLRIKKKLKKWFIDGETVGKKTNSWQDQMPLKV